MVVRSEQEAMFVACEMESTAVQLYSRALALMDQQGRQNDPLYKSIREMLEDEKGHLCRFRSLYQGLDEADEQQLTLSAVGEGVLFEGGLMGAARRGLLKDVESIAVCQMNVHKSEVGDAMCVEPLHALGNAFECGKNLYLRIECRE